MFSISSLIFVVLVVVLCQAKHRCSATQSSWFLPRRVRRFAWKILFFARQIFPGPTVVCWGSQHSVLGNYFCIRSSASFVLLHPLHPLRPCILHIHCILASFTSCILSSIKWYVLIFIKVALVMFQSLKITLP